MFDRVFPSIAEAENGTLRLPASDGLDSRRRYADHDSASWCRRINVSSAEAWSFLMI
eukprot:m.476760 g.476760  ORF g.476760 m.476760 type:complete len:57 (-) comp41760_c0_seq1:672-842(-)